MQESLALRNSLPSPASIVVEAIAAFHFPSGEHGGWSLHGTLPDIDRLESLHRAPHAHRCRGLHGIPDLDVRDGHRGPVWFRLDLREASAPCARCRSCRQRFRSSRGDGNPGCRNLRLIGWPRRIQRRNVTLKKPEEPVRETLVFEPMEAVTSTSAMGDSFRGSEFRSRTAPRTEFGPLRQLDNQPAARIPPRSATTAA